MANDKVLKLIKILKVFSKDDILEIIDIGESELSVILDNLINAGTLEVQNEKYSIIEKTQPNIQGFELIKIEKNYSSNILLRDLVFEYINSQNLTPSTRKGYLSIINSRLIPYFKNSKAADITLEDIEEFITAQSKIISPKSLSNAVTFWGSVLRFAHLNGIISVNPYNGVKNSKVQPHKKLRILNKKEIAQLLKMSENFKELNLLIQIILRTGMKKAEIFALEKEDILDTQININKTCSNGYIRKIKPKIIQKPNLDFEIFIQPRAKTYAFNQQLRRQFFKIKRELGLDDFCLDDLRFSNFI